MAATSNNTPALLKLCVLGDGGVGKTAVTIQLVSHHFVEEYDPTIEDSYRKQLVVDGETAVLEILDTAGQAEYTALRDQWIRQSEGFILVYNIANKDSLDHLGPIRQHILRVKEEDVGKVPIVLVGNKADLVDKRQVSTAEGQQLAEQWNSRLFETSAKVRTNIDEVFEYVVRQIRGVGAGPDDKKKTKAKLFSKKNILKQLKCKTL